MKTLKIILCIADVVLSIATVIVVVANWKAEKTK